MAMYKNNSFFVDPEQLAHSKKGAQTGPEVRDGIIQMTNSLKKTASIVGGGMLHKHNTNHMAFAAVLADLLDHFANKVRQVKPDSIKESSQAPSLKK